jgi:hypothetical protein
MEIKEAHNEITSASPVLVGVRDASPLLHE